MWWMALLACAGSDPLDCPVGSPCTRALPDGQYVVQTARGERPEAGWPVLLFFHGYRGSPDKFVDDTGEAQVFADAGLLYALPVSADTAWSMGGDWGERDDRDFVAELLDDLDERVGIDRDHLYVSGQSAGGAMVHWMACLDGDAYAGYAPMSGVFFTPLPEVGDCTASPAPLRHRHGTNDTTWPLEGRDFGGVAQGPPEQVMATWAEQWSCTASSTETTEAGTCTTWSGCQDDVPLMLCLDDGAHAPPDGWAEDVVSFLLP